MCPFGVSKCPFQWEFFSTYLNVSVLFCLCFCLFITFYYLPVPVLHLYYSFPIIASFHTLMFPSNICPLLLISFPSDSRFMTFALFISFTIPACSLVPLPFGFLVLTHACFLTILWPVDFVSRISEYLVTELLHIKDNVFCILPGLHLVPCPNVTVHHFSPLNCLPRYFLFVLFADKIWVCLC